MEGNLALSLYPCVCLPDFRLMCPLQQPAGTDREKTKQQRRFIRNFRSTCCTMLILEGEHL